jgi:Cu(I)/Ag(I) efflux system membrane fusion protein
MKPAYFLVAAIAAACGWYGALHFRHAPGAPSKDEAADSRRILLYQSPMHPWVKSDKPGQCTVCGMDLVPVYEGGKNFDHAASDVVMLPPGSPNVFGVKTAEVKKQPLVRTLRVAGMIGEDESRHGIISAPVEGRIDALAMSHEGQVITRRQPLATIFSRTLLSAAKNYKLALEQGGVAVEEAKRKLEHYGLVWEQINAIPTRQPDDLYFGILAPLTGTIVKGYISEGQYVKEGDRLFEIADFTKMWFMFPASEQDLPLLQVGQIATLTAPSLPGQTLKARVAFISPNLEEMTHSAMVRVVLENPERRIKNKSFAAGIVELEVPEVLAIPRSAVLWPGAQPRVYVEQAPGAYEQRSVKLGRAGDVLWEVLDGLKEGERVVQSGNMLIDGQAQLDSGMQDSGAGSKP